MPTGSTIVTTGIKCYLDSTKQRQMSGSTCRLSFPDVLQGQRQALMPQTEHLASVEGVNNPRVCHPKQDQCCWGHCTLSSDSVFFTHTKIPWLFFPISPNILKSICITVELIFIRLFRFLFLVWKCNLSLKLAEACSILIEWTSGNTKHRGSWDITLARFALGKTTVTAFCREGKYKWQQALSGYQARFHLLSYLEDYTATGSQSKASDQRQEKLDLPAALIGNLPQLLLWDVQGGELRAPKLSL